MTAASRGSSAGPMRRRGFYNGHTPTGPPAGPRPARGRGLGSLIGGSFGLVFVWINSAGLASVPRICLVGLAAAAFVAVVTLSHRDYRRQTGAPQATQPAQAIETAGASTPAGAGAAHDGGKAAFGIAYWVVVAVEAILLFLGTRLIIAATGLPEVGVAWVSVVVGTHFFALGRVFALARFHVLAACVTSCGLAGFGLAAAGLPAAIAVVSGVVPGFMLLGFCAWAFAPGRQTSGHADFSR